MLRAFYILLLGSVFLGYPFLRKNCAETLFWFPVIENSILSNQRSFSHHVMYYCMYFTTIINILMIDYWIMLYANLIYVKWHIDLYICLGTYIFYFPTSISGTTKQALSKTHQLLNTDDEALLSEISSSSDDEDTLSSGPALTCPCPPRSQATTTSAIHGYLGGVSLLSCIDKLKK